jgi:hypothetical protein
MLDDPVVVHFKDGRTLQGYAEEFLPSDSEILLRDATTDEDVTVFLHQVKVVCFVRNLFSTGVVRNREIPPIQFRAPAGRRVDLAFKDGEKLAGVVDLKEEPTRGFFLTPLNPNANSLRIYINPSELVSFKFVT